MATQANTSPAADIAGVIFSALCVIHCLALPLMAAFLPLAASIAEMETLHKAFVVFAALAAGVALAQGPMRLRFGVIAGLGLALLIAGAFVEALHDHETSLTVVGAVILAGAHILRWRSGAADAEQTAQ